MAGTEPVPAYVVVSGPPGSGKTTLAGPLARELGRPLVAKDTIKQALMSVLEVPDVESSRLLGRASVAALLAVATESRAAVLESVWHRSGAGPQLERLPGGVVEVFCRCPRELAAQRYRSRAGTRSAEHFVGQREPEELWDDEIAQPVAAGWPVLEVDTSQQVDVVAVADWVRGSGALR